ncbi:MAG TPA: haloacid dehalogenase [Actinobacteria bacterium]|nr:haloacid dehalogenase [Actinomycetota bacterium]
MDLGEISAKIRREMDAKDTAREGALTQSRRAIRASSNAIRAIHRGEYKSAGEFLAEARMALDECENLLHGHPDIYHAGFVRDAQKEYAEAMITLVLICGEPLPDLDELRVGHVSYLNGLAETIGELRRHILDIIREDRLEQGESLLKAMDDIYYVLVSFDYPDAVTPGLRRATDVARAIMEKTRGDLTTAIRQKELREAMGKLEERLREKKE